MQVTAIRFKWTGKYYDEEKLDILPNEITDDGKLAIMYLISDRLKIHYRDTLEQGFYVYITVEDIGYPCLLLPN